MTPITRSMASKMTPMEASIDASHPPAIESFSSETTSTPEECVLDDKRRFTSEELFHMPQFEFSVVKNTESDYEPGALRAVDPDFLKKLMKASFASKDCQLEVQLGEDEYVDRAQREALIEARKEARKKTGRLVRKEARLMAQVMDRLESQTGR